MPSIRINDRRCGHPATPLDYCRATCRGSCRAFVAHSAGATNASMWSDCPGSGRNFQPSQPTGESFVPGSKGTSMMRPMLTQKRLREVLHHAPESGAFTWLRGRRKGRVAGTRHDHRGFLKVGIDGERHLLHRLAWLWMTGIWSRWRIEQINGDHADNRWSNLREGSRLQKRDHRPARREITGIPGVWRVGSRFEALVQVAGVTMNLASFPSARMARAAIALTDRRARERGVSSRREAA